MTDALYFGTCQEEDMAERDALEEMTLALRRLEHLVKCTDVTSKTPRGSTQNPFDGLLKVVGRYKTAQGSDAEVSVKIIIVFYRSWLILNQNTHS